MQHWGFSTVVLRLMAIVGVLAGMLTMAGCPGGEQARVAASNAIVPLSATTDDVLNGQTLTFTSGTVLGAAAPVTLTFTNTTAATPNFTLISGAGATARTATGTVAFSTNAAGQAVCTFTVQTSNFGNPLAVPGPLAGAVITVTPCNINLATLGVPCGQSVAVNVTVTLGTSTSSSFSATVIIDCTTGIITLNGVNTGVSVVLQTTGGSGAGS